MATPTSGPPSSAQPTPDAASEVVAPASPETAVAPDAPPAADAAAGDATGPDAASGDAPLRRRVHPGSLVYAVTGIVAAVWLLLDQATKQLAVTTLEGRTPIDLGVLDLRVVRNPGGAFSIPGLFDGIFVVITVVVLVLVVRALPHTDRLSLATAYGLVLGGALGNCVDRVARFPGFPSGHVVDFFDFRWFPVFNVADIGITSGAGLVAVLLLVMDREDRAQRAARRDPVRPQAEGFATVGVSDLRPPASVSGVAQEPDRAASGGVGDPPPEPSTAPQPPSGGTSERVPVPLDGPRTVDE